MKVLVYGNRKQDDMLWDISTPEKESAAFLELFRFLDEEWQVYTELAAKEKSLYTAASYGDPASAKKLLERRKDYEYEEWHYAEVIDPLVKQ